MEGCVFCSIETQIEILESRGMIIGNRTFAKDYLMFGNYYNVVNAFKHYILDPNFKTERYKEGLSFRNLADLCEFDSSLRILFLEYLLKAELGLKTHFAYELAKLYGPFGYLCLDAYNSSRPKDIAYARSLVDELEWRIEENVTKSDFVNHFIVRKKSQVPIWSLVNILEFGTLRRLYQNINPNVCNHIAKNYYSLPARTLLSMICSLNVWRNLCAHGSCLIRFRMKGYKKGICDTSLHAYLDVEKDGLYYQKGKGDLLSIVISLKYLLKQEDFSNFICSLKKVILSFGKKIAASPINLADILKETGIPSPSDSKGRRFWTKIEGVVVSDLTK